MTAPALIYTTLLMGFLVVMAGMYGGLYAVHQLRPRPALLALSVACYAVVMGLAALIVWSTPLTRSWKALIAVSALAYAFIPPMAWRFLVRLHDAGESSL